MHPGELDRRHHPHRVDLGAERTHASELPFLTSASVPSEYAWTTANARPRIGSGTSSMSGSRRIRASTEVTSSGTVWIQSRQA